MKTINSNHLEYINKELMNMDENIYSHFELYQWHNEYLNYRLFTDEDFKQMRFDSESGLDICIKENIFKLIN